MVTATDRIQEVVSRGFTYTFPVREVATDTYALVRGSEELLKLQRDWLAFSQLDLLLSDGRRHAERTYPGFWYYDMHREFTNLETRLWTFHAGLQYIGKRYHLLDQNWSADLFSLPAARVELWKEV